MSEPERTPLSEIKQTITSLAADLREMVGLRWDLARLELKAAGKVAVWLGISLAIAAVLALSVLPVLVVAAAEWLDGCWRLSRGGWLLVLGLSLLALAVLEAYLAWRRFRREFVGLQQTLEELHEDLVWLKDWTSHRRPEAEEPKPEESAAAE